MRIRNVGIHKEGRRILVIVLALLVVINMIVIKNYTASNLLFVLSITLSSIFYLWMLYFFRDPVRQITQREGYVLVPADGKVIDIKEVYEDEYFKTKRIQVSIFMSPFNVHVNRYPISGVLKFFKYHPGKYLVAFHPKSSKKNERTTVVVENEDGFQVLFRQIAGFIARRIKFYNNPGEIVQQGAECGFIKFGSRADVFLPLDARIKVKIGDRVKGGVSVLAAINKEKSTT